MYPGLSRSRSSASDPIESIWRLAVTLALLSILLPYQSEQVLSEMSLPAGLNDYLKLLPAQGYEFIKSAILWIPLGLLAALAGKEHILRALALLLMPFLLLLVVPLLAAPRVHDLMQVLFVFPGLAAGLWLGTHARLRSEALGGQSRPFKQAQRAQANTPDQYPAKPEQAADSRPAMKRGEAAPVPAHALAVSPGHEGDGAHASESPVAAAAPGGPSTTTPSDSGIQPMSASFIAGLCLLGLVGYGLYDFPRFQFPLAALLALYAALLWRWPLAWVVAVPLALPLLDLAPWTGRYFFDEFDLLMLLTLAVLLLRGQTQSGAGLTPMTRVGLGLLGLSVLVSVLIGLLPHAPLDANAFNSYWSPYNSLRVAKGFMWGAAIFVLLRQSKVDYNLIGRRFALGMGLGLLGVGLIGAWEHHLFVGFEDRLETYRIVSTFSSMHTGGGHIEAYLVAALPFLWLATSRFRHLAFTAPVMLLTAYVMLYTVARGGVLALGVVLVILLVASARLALRSHGRRFVAPVAVLVGVGLVLAGGVGVGYFQQRFADTGRDWQIRVDHWGVALDMRDGSIGAQMFGMGLGSFPRVYQERGPVDKQPASFGFASEQGNPYFRLGTGETVYYAQRIPFSAGKTYRLEVDLRSRQGDARLDTPVCEKQLLNSRQCEWFSFNVPGDGEWHRQSHTFSSNKVGAEGWWNRPPVELFLYQPGKGTVVDVDNLRLVDPEGRDVLCNGDFSRGGDCWFFKTHSHLPWHIKNVWVQVLFEQGWLGLMLFTGVTLLALTRLAREGWKGHRLAWAWLASLAGLLTVGLFDSLLDTPRLASLLVSMLLLGVAPPWQTALPARRHHRRSGRHARS